MSAAARESVARARGVVDAAVARGDVVYGVNTGFGNFADVVIPRERLQELQLNLVRSHAAGVGDALDEAETRALMVLRANVLAKGFSGARPALPELLVGMLNAGLWPPIPEQGSVGASGDLGPWSAGGRATVRPLTQAPYVNGADGFGSGTPDRVVAGMADGSARFIACAGSSRRRRRPIARRAIGDSSRNRDSPSFGSPREERKPRVRPSAA